MNTIAISDLRSNLPNLIKHVSDKLDRLVVTVSGKPKAVVLSVEELDSLEETAEILAVPGALRKIKESQQQIVKNQGIDLEDLAKKYKLK